MNRIGKKIQDFYDNRSNASRTRDLGFAHPKIYFCSKNNNINNIKVSRFMIYNLVTDGPTDRQTGKRREVHLYFSVRLFIWTDGQTD